MLRKLEEASMTSVFVIKFFVNFKTHGFTKIGLIYYYKIHASVPNNIDLLGGWRLWWRLRVDILKVKYFFWNCKEYS